MLLEVHVCSVVREIHGIVSFTYSAILCNKVFKCFNQCPVCSGVVVQVSKRVSVQCRLKFSNEE